MKKKDQKRKNKKKRYEKSARDPDSFSIKKKTFSYEFFLLLRKNKFAFSRRRVKSKSTLMTSHYCCHHFERSRNFQPQNFCCHKKARVDLKIALALTTTFGNGECELWENGQKLSQNHITTTAVSSEYVKCWCDISCIRGLYFLSSFRVCCACACTLCFDCLTWINNWIFSIQ